MTNTDSNVGLFDEPLRQCAQVKEGEWQRVGVTKRIDACRDGWLGAWDAIKAAATRKPRFSVTQPMTFSVYAKVSDCYSALTIDLIQPTLERAEFIQPTPPLTTSEEIELVRESVRLVNQYHMAMTRKQRGVTSTTRRELIAFIRGLIAALADRR